MKSLKIFSVSSHTLLHDDVARAKSKRCHVIEQDAADDRAAGASFVGKVQRSLVLTLLDSRGDRILRSHGHNRKGCMKALLHTRR